MRLARRLRPIRSPQPALACRLGAVLLAASTLAAAADELKWKAAGPAPTIDGQVEGIARGAVVGAVNDLAPHPTNADVLFAGTVNGGIWRTRNATSDEPHWESLTDQQASLSIGAIEFDPTDPSHATLVAGIGRTSSYDRQGGKLVGLLVTADGGDTWSLEDGGGTLRDLDITGVAPRGGIVVVAARGSGSERWGIWRRATREGPWVRISARPGSGLPDGPAFDLVGIPGDPAVLYTNAGGAGIYRSADTGATWAKVDDAAFAGLLGDTTNNVEFATGTDGHVFVAVVNFGRLAGVLRSPNGRAPWTSLDVPQTIENGQAVGIHPGGQGNIHLSLAADPTSADIVYIGGDRQPMRDEAGASPPYFPNSIGAWNYTGRLFRIDASKPRGSQAEPLTHSGTAGNSAPHADSRDMAFDAAGTLVEADDGGVYRRTSPRDRTGDWQSRNGDLQTTEFVAVVWDSVAKVAVGGAQDTGAPEGTSAAQSRWRSVVQGDGADVAVDDRSTPGRSWRYTSAQELRVFRRRQYDQSNTFLGFRNIAVPADLSPQWFTPIELNQVNPARLVVGAANDIYESLDRGNSLVPLGAGISVNAGTEEAHPLAYGARDDVNVLYAGVGNRVWVRKGSGTLRASAAITGAATISDIALDPKSSRRAFALDRRGVYGTTNAGSAWSNLTGNLSALTPGGLRTIEFLDATGGLAGGVDTDAIAVGAENGVYVAKGPAFNRWLPLGIGLPKSAIMRLDFDAVDKILLAGTLGRGAWTLDLKRPAATSINLSSELLFEYRSAEIKPAADAALSDIVRRVRDRSPAATAVEVEGHTDAVGSQGYNQRLSEDRARNTGARLVALGLPAGLIRTRGFGEDRPVDSNETEAGRTRNRRVEIRILP